MPGVQRDAIALPADRSVDSLAMPKRPVRHLLLFIRWSCATTALAILSVWVASLFGTLEYDSLRQDWSVTITSRTVSLCRFDMVRYDPFWRGNFRFEWIAEANHRLAFFASRGADGWSVHISWWLLVPLLFFVLLAAVCPRGYVRSVAARWRWLSIAIAVLTLAMVFVLRGTAFVWSFGAFQIANDEGFVTVGLLEDKRWMPSPAIPNSSPIRLRTWRGPLWFYYFPCEALTVLASTVAGSLWVSDLLAKRRRRRNAAMNLCPFCRYDLSGLLLRSADATHPPLCPECGKAVDHVFSFGQTPKA